MATLDEAGQTALIVAVDGQVVGLLGARDRVRREAHDVVHDLKHLGLKDLTILTGDRPAPARSVGKKVHIKTVEAELTPADKADWVHKKQHEGKVVAMIGDGINDAPALAMADVGIALGGVGTDIAAEAGSIVLMGDPLAPLPDAITLARRTVRNIRQNIIVFAFGLNGLAVLLAGLRVLGPVAAAIVHQIGSLLVILNAIRLLGFEGWRQFGLVRAGERDRRRLPSLPTVGRLRLGRPTSTRPDRRRGGRRARGLSAVGARGDRAERGRRPPAIRPVPRAAARAGAARPLAAADRAGHGPGGRPRPRRPRRPGRAGDGPARRHGRMEHRTCGNINRATMPPST